MATLRPLLGDRGYVLDYRLRDPGQRHKIHLKVSRQRAHAILDEVNAHLPKLRGLLTDTTMFDWMMQLREELPPPLRASP